MVSYRIGIQKGNENVNKYKYKLVTLGTPPPKEKGGNKTFKKIIGRHGL